ncbi:MAG: hypothetical protein M5U07_15710 [Xanthobacteraceae bacterium]|nr:hypothetical protein [Xanthobacteraceae bacterium]
MQNRFTIDASGVFEAAFQQMDIHHFTPNVLADLIVSVSALEHIPDDVRLLERVQQWGQVPSSFRARCRGPYLWHGIGNTPSPVCASDLVTKLRRAARRPWHVARAYGGHHYS